MVGLLERVGDSIEWDAMRIGPSLSLPIMGAILTLHDLALIINYWSSDREAPPTNKLNLTTRKFDRPIRGCKPADGASKALRTQIF